MKQVRALHSGAPAPFRCVLAQMTGLSSTQVALLIRMGGAYLGKHRCKEGDRLVKKGEVVAAYYRLPLVLETVTFQTAWILRDGPALLVADKPMGLPTQGRRDGDYMAFYEVLKNHLTGYLGLHHRLDQDTSGLLLFTRDRKFNRTVSEAFRERLVEKEYLAVARGAWPFSEDEALVDQPIGPLRLPSGTKQRVVSGGKPALTHVHRLVTEGDLHLLAVVPKTGRTHQIRVHLSFLGLPLAGDTLYGGGRESGFFLHCHRLAWPRLGRLAADGVYAPLPPRWSAELPGAMLDFYQSWKRG